MHGTRNWPDEYSRPVWTYIITLGKQKWWQRTLLLKIIWLLALRIKLLWLSDPTKLKILDTTCNNIFLPHRAKCMKKKLSTEASTSEIALSVFFYISLWSWFEASTANSPAASGWKAWTCAGSNSAGPCCIVSVGSHNHRNAILIWFIKIVENS